jgi:hypothetical protein
MGANSIDAGAPTTPPQAQWNDTDAGTSQPPVADETAKTAAADESLYNDVSNALKSGLMNLPFVPSAFAFGRLMQTACEGGDVQATFLTEVKAGNAPIVSQAYTATVDYMEWESAAEQVRWEEIGGALAASGFNALNLSALNQFSDAGVSPVTTAHDGGTRQSTVP